MNFESNRFVEQDDHFTFSTMDRCTELSRYKSNLIVHYDSIGIMEYGM